MAKTETLDERAARVAAETADVQQQLAQRQREEYQRRAAHEQRFDEELVAGWDPAELDRAVIAARRALDLLVDEMPLTLALADWVAAQTRRRVAWSEHLGALGRLGQPVEGAELPAPSGELFPGELIAQAADIISGERIAIEQQEQQSRRTPPEGTTT